MRVAMFYELFYPSHGGIESWIAHVSEVMKKKGIDVDIITGHIPSSPREEYINGIRVLRLDDRKNRISMSFTQGFSNMKRQMYWVKVGIEFWKKHKDDYDIIHPHVQASFLSALLGSRSPEKIVWSWHGTYHEHLYEMFPPLSALIYDIGEHISVKLPYARCITADRYTKKLAIKHMGADPTKMIAVSNGVDINKFRPMKVKKPAEWGEGFHVLVTRRLVKKNGLQFLIPAMKKIVERDKDIHLIIYGDGVEKPYLEDMVKKLRLQNNVHFMGIAKHDDMPKLINAADIVVLPSLIEATSLSCLEAMACGKLLITTPVGGIPDITNKETVVYAKPGSIKSLEYALNKAIFEMSSSERKNIGKKARNKAKMFTWENTAKKIIEVYNEVSD